MPHLLARNRHSSRSVSGAVIPPEIAVQMTADANGVVATADEAKISRSCNLLLNVILDLGLPELSGERVHALLRQRYQSCRSSFHQGTAMASGSTRCCAT